VKNRIAMFAAALMVAAAALAPAAQAQTDLVYPNYYVGVDARPTVLFQGNPVTNPNLNRLSFLLAHTYPDDPIEGLSPAINHYHGIGIYTLRSDGTPRNTNNNNRIPETFSGHPPLELLWHNGYYQSGLTGIEEYDGLHLASVDRLKGAAANTPEWYLFTSSGNRWSTLLEDAQIALVLENMTDGLYVGTMAGENLFASGNTYLLGTGSELAANPFLPVFWTSNPAQMTPTKYSASFHLTDLSGRFGDSGIFYLDFQVAAVPEPGICALFGAGLIALTLGARRRRR
jgi:hypothetical protein